MSNPLPRSYGVVSGARDAPGRVARAASGPRAPPVSTVPSRPEHSPNLDRPTPGKSPSRVDADLLLDVLPNFVPREFGDPGIAGKSADDNPRMSVIVWHTNNLNDHRLIPAKHQAIAVPGFVVDSVVLLLHRCLCVIETVLYAGRLGERPPLCRRGVRRHGPCRKKRNPARQEHD